MTYRYALAIPPWVRATSAKSVAVSARSQTVGTTVARAVPARPYRSPDADLCQTAKDLHHLSQILQFSMEHVEAIRESQRRGDEWLIQLVRHIELLARQGAEWLEVDQGSPCRPNQ